MSLKAPLYWLIFFFFAVIVFGVLFLFFCTLWHKKNWKGETTASIQKESIVQRQVFNYYKRMTVTTINYTCSFCPIVWKGKHNSLNAGAVECAAMSRFLSSLASAQRHWNLFSLRLFCCHLFVSHRVGRRPTLNCNTTEFRHWNFFTLVICIGKWWC